MMYGYGIPGSVVVGSRPFGDPTSAVDYSTLSRLAAALESEADPGAAVVTVTETVPAEAVAAPADPFVPLPHWSDEPNVLRITPTRRQAARLRAQAPPQAPPSRPWGLYALAAVALIGGYYYYQQQASMKKAKRKPATPTLPPPVRF